MKRGELRRLAATQNKRLNSTGEINRTRPDKTSSDYEVPRCLARDLFYFGLGISDCGLSAAI